MSLEDVRLDLATDEFSVVCESLRRIRKRLQVLACSTTPGGSMRFLLTSSGISNASIHDALVELLGKPIAESGALCIPTGVQPFPGGPSHVYRFISGSTESPMCGLGWKSLGVLELTALPSIRKEHWVPAVQDVDALLVWGGSPLYLCYWMRESGLADLLPSLRGETVYVGTSGGAMVATPDFGGETYDDSEPLTGSDRALGLVDFSVFPHLEREDMPDTSLANIERWAAGLSVPAYAIDDQTAIKVVDGTVEVVSEGHWKLFNPEPGSKLAGAGDTRRSTAPTFRNDA
jgi:dipeptidase E